MVEMLGGDGNLVNLMAWLRPGAGNGDTPAPLGSVTIPPNHESPQLGTVIEVGYLSLRRSTSMKTNYEGYQSDDE
jgi:hypothetical protein